MNVNEVLQVFCHYGFRKASMEDLARAAELSRQSLYKKFGSKDAIFEWAMTQTAEETSKAALAALNAEHSGLPERIANAFDRWIGDYVPMLRATPHGAEILEKATALYHQKGHQGEEEIHQRIADLLCLENPALSEDKATDMVFALVMAAKGLMLKSENAKSFRAGIERVISALLN